MEYSTRRLTEISLLLLAAGLMAGAAGCERQARPIDELVIQQEAQVSFFNATHDVIPTRFQTMRNRYALDCELVATDPGRFLREEHLTNQIREDIFSGFETGLDRFTAMSSPGGPDHSSCRFSILLIDDDRLPDIAVTWPRNLPMKTFFNDVDAPADVPPQPNTIIAEADYSNASSSQVPRWRARPCAGTAQSSLCTEGEREQMLQPPAGAQYHWSVLGDDVDFAPWQSATLVDMGVEDPQDAACQTGRSSRPLSWTSTTSGRWTILGVEELGPGPGDSSNGGGFSEANPCYLVRLWGNEREESWQFCGSRRLARRIDPDEMLSRGDIKVEFFVENQYGSPASYQNLTLDLRRETESGELFELETIELIRGNAIPDHIGPNWEVAAVTSCETRREVSTCEQVVLPSNIYVPTSGGQTQILPGEHVGVGPVAQRSVEFIRGMHRAIVDVNCAHEDVGPFQLANPGAYVELIYYAGVTSMLD